MDIVRGISSTLSLALSLRFDFRELEKEWLGMVFHAQVIIHCFKVIVVSSSKSAHGKIDAVK